MAETRDVVVVGAGQAGLVASDLLRERKSGILYGVGEDAARIVDHIKRYVLSTNHKG